MGRGKRERRKAGTRATPTEAPTARSDQKDVPYITRGKFPRECPDPKPRKAQLWINHDKPQSATLRYAPAYYE